MRHVLDTARQAVTLSMSRQSPEGLEDLIEEKWEHLDGIAEFCPYFLEEEE